MLLGTRNKQLVLQRLQHDFTCVYYWLEIKPWWFRSVQVRSVYYAFLFWFICLLYPMDFRELHADRILQVTSALNYSQKCMCTFSHLLPFRKGLHRYTPSCIQICNVGKKNKRCKRKKVFKCLMCATLFKVWGQYFIKINHFIKLRGIKLTNSERVDFIWINSVLWENFRLERHI